MSAGNQGGGTAGALLGAMGFGAGASPSSSSGVSTSNAQTLSGGVVNFGTKPGAVNWGALAIAGALVFGALVVSRGR